MPLYNSINNSPTTYLFVDGSHFRQYFNETTQKWFGQEVEFDFRKIKHFFNAEKAFYYDCIDDIKNDNETNEEFEVRVNTQEEKLNKIREVQGCHVFLGSLRKAKKRKNRGQKEVDVMLAVQMMEHAFRVNMNKAVLLSGDLDFRPLVESLIRLGLFVEVVGDQNHISQDLIHAADNHKKLDFETYYNWTPDDLIQLNPIDFEPQQTNHVLEHYKQYFQLLKKGVWKEHEIFIYKSNGKVTYFIIAPSLLKNNAYGHQNLEKMELYIGLRWGEVIWE